MTQEMLNKLIEAEGGWKFIRVPHDKGGDTFAGISKRANPRWEGWGILNKYEPNTDLPEEVVTELKPLVNFLYKTNYWETVHLDDSIYGEFGDHAEIEELKVLLFHISVLSGPRIAIFALQNALGGIAADGLWGPNTREKLATELGLFANYNNQEENNNIECLQRGIILTMINRFVRICLNDRSQDRFLLGWAKRMLELA